MSITPTPTEPETREWVPPAVPRPPESSSSAYGQASQPNGSAADGSVAPVQPWMLKNQPAPQGQPAGGEEEAKPWWERPQQAEATPAPQPSPAPPAPPSIHAISMEGVPGLTMEGMPGEPEVRPAAPRHPRGPVPGITTRPAEPRSVRPLFVGLAGLAVAAAIGMPVARYFMTPAPTVVIADPEDLPVLDTKLPDVSIPAEDPSLTRRPGGPPRGVSAPAAVVVTPEPVTPKRQNARRVDRAAAAAILRHNEKPVAAGGPVLPTLATSAPGPVAEAPPPAPEPVQEPEPVAEQVGQIYEQTQVDERPQIASQAPPQLPASFQASTDIVVVRVLVLPSGRTGDVNLLRKSRSGESVDAAVINAVRRWTFSPARRRGQSVSCWYNVGVPLKAE